MKGVILAAGQGTRLSANNGTRHKVLLRVGGKAIIDYALESFSSVGITDLAIVIGHQGNAVREWVGDGSKHGLNIRYVFNHEYMWGNALSLYAVRSFTDDDPFILSMADHMFSPSLLQRVIDMNSSTSVLAVDSRPDPRHITEGTRVLVNDVGLITSIGKDLPSWDGIDAGVFRLVPAIFDSITDIVSEKSTEYQLSQAITRMINQGHPLEACDITGCFWQDVDTWEDLKLVRQTFEGAGRWQNSRKA